jgi:RES domain-containing protein
LAGEESRRLLGGSLHNGNCPLASSTAEIMTGSMEKACRMGHIRQAWCEHDRRGEAMLATTTLVVPISSRGEGTPEGCLALRGEDAQARIRLATISAGRRPTVRVVAARSSPVARSGTVAKIKPGRQIKPGRM